METLLMTIYMATGQCWRGEVYPWKGKMLSKYLQS